MFVDAVKCFIQTSFFCWSLLRKTTITIVLTNSLVLLGCVNYEPLSDADRAQDYWGLIRCDKYLPKFWYRFMGDAGNKMADKCVPKQQCGTTAPGWLSGGHPTVAQGIVNRKVCFHGSSGCCQWSSNIRVRNCGAFFVYELMPPPACSLRYCVEIEGQL